MRLLYDRGTILLDGPAPVWIAEIPGVLWDPRVRRYRAPAWRYAEIVRLLSGRVRFSDGVFCEAPRVELGPIPLRSYQAEALAAWERAGRRGVIVLPTGAGKTRVGLAAIASAGRPALCLVPTRVLLHQWCHELSMCAAPLGRYGDGARDLGPVTVATYESAYRHMDALGRRFELLVVDEAHHFGTGLRDEALEMCAAPARLGLTATPLGNGPAAAQVAALLGPTVYELGVGDLTGAFLAACDFVTLHLELEGGERTRYDRLVARFREAHGAFQRTAPGATWGDFAAAATRTAEGREALAAWRESWRIVSLCAAKRAAIGRLLDAHRDARVLVFTADNAAAYAIALEHLVMPLTCDIGRAERDEALERFRRGELRALVSARVLNEGIDVPSAEVAVIAGGSLGRREHVQRVGRLLRPAPGKRALVYELVVRDSLEVARARQRRKGLAARGPARPRLE
jgi:superfamily II DNA or RNA helicase